MGNARTKKYGVASLWRHQLSGSSTAILKTFRQGLALRAYLSCKKKLSLEKSHQFPYLHPLFFVRVATELKKPKERSPAFYFLTSRPLMRALMRTDSITAALAWTDFRFLKQFISSVLGALFRRCGCPFWALLSPPFTPESSFLSLPTSSVLGQPCICQHFFFLCSVHWSHTKTYQLFAVTGSRKEGY